MAIKNLSIGFTLSICVLSGLGNVCLAETTTGFSKFVDETGVISMPQDFRKTMTHLGSWFVPSGEASGFHDVYSRQADVNAYRKTGEFPEGAVLIKELRSSHKADYTTGRNVSRATELIKQWFVMVKGNKSRFPDNKNWGDGWGWALFKADNLKVNVSSDYQKDCLACHLPAKKNNFVYIEGYPTLSK